MSTQIPIYSWVLPVLALFLSCSPEANRMDRLMQAYSGADLFSGSVLVAQGDQIIYHEAFGWSDRQNSVPMEVETAHRIGSVTKPLTASLIRKLVAEGYFTPDQTLAELLPDYKGEGSAEITVRHLLQHRAGIISSLPPEKELVAERRQHNLAELMDYAASTPPKFKAGRDFSYSNFGYALLAAIAEEQTETAFTKLMDKHVFTPAGMMHSGCNSIGKGNVAQGYEHELVHGYIDSSPIHLSYAIGYGNVLSTSEDLYSWVQHEKDYFDTSREGQVGNDGLFRNRIPVHGGQDTLVVLEHHGSINGFGSYLLYVPSIDLTIVVLKNFRSAHFLQPIYATTIGKQLLALYHDDPVELPLRSVALDIAPLLIIEGADLESAYSDLIKRHDGKLNFHEDELNKLGIELLFGLDMKGAASDVFELNMRLFPTSYNVYDSYAYARLMLGDTLGAIDAYETGFSIFEQYRTLNDTENNRNNLQTARKLVQSLGSN